MLSRPVANGGSKQSLANCGVHGANGKGVLIAGSSKRGYPIAGGINQLPRALTNVRALKSLEGPSTETGES